MKKLFLLSVFVLLSLSSTKLNAQIEQDDSLINFAVGLSSYYTSGSGFKTTLPPIDASYEYMVSDAISVGGFIGAYSSEYEYPTIFNDFEIIKFNYFNVGALGNYHFVNNEDFNVYVGARLGYLKSKAKYDERDDDIGSLDEIDFQASGFLFGLQIGARYFVSESIALNAELGYGISLLRFGITFKL